MTKEIQLRGHCQFCGNEQAVRNDHMAHHGYEVARWGFFSGTCQGHDHSPLEQDRVQADQLVGTLRQQANEHAEQACRLHDGSEDPEFILVTRRERKAAELHAMSRYVEVTYHVPFCYGDEWEQSSRRKSMVFALEQRAQQKRAFCDMLSALADRVHGQPLRAVDKSVKPAPLAKRVKTADGTVLVMSYMERGRVYYTSPRRSAWVGTQTWRSFEVVEQ